MLVSCSSTTDPSLELTTPAYTDAGSPLPALAMAAADAEIDDAKSGKPAKTAAAPDNKPDEQVASGKDTTAPETDVAKDEARKPADTKAEAVAANKAAASVPVPGAGDVLENGGPVLTAGVMPDAPIPAKKKSFLSSFFGATPAQAAPSPEKKTETKPLVALEDEAKPAKPVRTASLSEGSGDFAFPGVRTTNLFEIKRKSGLDDDSDIDVHEDVDGPPVVLASAAGLARLAPNGLLRQRESVDVACLKPALVRVLKTVERHYGKKMVVTSGYRSPSYNRKVNGAKKSQHIYCAAADVQVPGVSKWELAKYVRSMPGRGGVGTYCHTESVHIDIGPERDWNWNCRKRT